MVLRARRHRCRNARRTAHRSTVAPRFHIGLAKTRTCQHERMPRSIRGGGPLGSVVPFRFEHDGVVLPTQPQRSAFVGKRTRPRPEHAGNSINRLHIRRHRCDDEKALRRDGRAGCERKVHIARNAPAREVFRPRVRVVELDKLRVFPVQPRRRMRHDFRENERRLFAGDSQRLRAALPAIRVNDTHRRRRRRRAVWIRHEQGIAARICQRRVCDCERRTGRTGNRHVVQRPLISRRRRAVHDRAEHRAIAHPEILRLRRKRDDRRRERIAHDRHRQIVQPPIRKRTRARRRPAILLANLDIPRRVFPRHIPRPEIKRAPARDRHHGSRSDRRNRLIDRQRHRPVRGINIRAL